MKQHIDREMLSAYMDGEVEPALMPDVEDAITQDESARDYIIDSVKTAARLRLTLNQTFEEKVPDQLIAALERRAGQKKRLKSMRLAIVQLAAAVVILLGGFLTGKMLPPAEDKTLPALTAELPSVYRQVVDEALENNLSGTPRQWRPPQDSITVTVTPVRTYRHRDGRYYREYRLEVNGGEQPVRINGLAYRAEQGRWTTRAIFF